MSPQVPWDNNTRWYNLFPYDPVKQGSVTAFNDKNCKSFFAHFDAGDEDTAVEKYNEQDLKYHGMPTKSISSVMVPEGYSLSLYSHDSFSGNPVVIKGEYTDNRQAIKCQNLSDFGFNEKTVSLEVTRTKQYENATSKWVKI